MQDTESSLLNPNELIVPIIPIRDGTIFPHTDSMLTFGRPKSLSALEAASQGDRTVCFVLQKNTRNHEPGPEDLYTIGTLAHIERMVKLDDNISAQVRGITRVRIESYENHEYFLMGKVTEIPETEDNSPEIKALCNHLTTEFRKAMNIGKHADFLVFMNIMSDTTPSQLADLVASVLEIKNQERQELLEIFDVKTRLEKVSDYLAKEIKVLELEQKIATKTQAKFDKGAKEAILREKLKTIEQELGNDEATGDMKELVDAAKNAHMPEDVYEKVKKEIKKLSQMNQFNPESGYIRNYVETLSALPWDIESKEEFDLKKAEKILNEEHYGLEKAKERILEYLAVRKLTSEKGTTMKSPILCFAGPPGVGKTSIGKSIAKALGRKFVRMSLGGVRDEAEIRGHRRTYVGALPGRIIQGIKDAGTKNPVFMLDEIDKLGSDYRGDPSSALLEALDPEQNNSFSDHYLEVPFDLSNVMFITTANMLDTIPPALRDRLEIISFSGYTQDEKFAIAKKYLLKKLQSNHGLSEDQIEMTDAALRFVIEHYTLEAGVRNLERKLADIFRKVAKQVADGKKTSVSVTPKLVEKYLGPERFNATTAEKKDEVGMSTGLGWSPSGGSILQIESTVMPGKGSLILTGQLGDVMKESGQAALSYIRARAKQFGLPEGFFQKIDIHVHMPEGAIPKDGPSAGLAITTSMISALTKIPVRKDVAMTGEVTLRGRALEIGGVKEKVIAAHRAGIKTVILPRENKKDVVEDVPKEVQNDLKFYYVSHMDEVLPVALAKTLSVSPQSSAKGTALPLHPAD